ncbi:MAG: DUF167 family protein [Desulfobacterales bacterium]|jgi:hypothetical protein
MVKIRKNPDGVIFKVFVQPRSSKNIICGLHGDALKIKLTAPPVDNAANQMCTKFLAKLLGVPKSSIEILSGKTGRTKQVLLRSNQANISGQEYNRLKLLIQKLVA